MIASITYAKKNSHPKLSPSSSSTTTTAKLIQPSQQTQLLSSSSSLSALSPSVKTTVPASNQQNSNQYGE
ncbi:unnamed protein product [Brugia pahangi]|uniref:Ovule protein n=1 Tax=Brugia pahangi TaxID=6280 RepID=A0A0N4TTA4_BRUPA|nr:unnamed protein product [Brugia pahangi]